MQKLTDSNNLHICIIFFKYTKLSVVTVSRGKNNSVLFGHCTKGKKTYVANVYTVRQGRLYSDAETAVFLSEFIGDGYGFDNGKIFAENGNGVVIHITDKLCRCAVQNLAQF